MSTKLVDNCKTTSGNNGLDGGSNGTPLDTGSNSTNTSKSGYEVRDVRTTVFVRFSNFPFQKRFSTYLCERHQ
jgi:hypothetical protein